MHYSIALERGKVSADSVIGYAERLAEILDGAVVTPQLGNDLTSCCIVKACVQTHGPLRNNYRRYQ
jgi:hypothetical protein